MGGHYHVSGYIPACTWETRQHIFATDVRVLSLGCYDMVMDWLEKCGPVLIDWTSKTLQFHHQGRQTQLTGLQARTQQVTPSTLDQLLLLEQSNSIAHVICVCISEQTSETNETPVEIQHILDRFQPVLKTKCGKP